MLHCFIPVGHHLAEYETRTVIFAPHAVSPLLGDDVEKTCGLWNWAFVAAGKEIALQGDQLQNAAQFVTEAYGLPQTYITSKSRSKG